MPMVCIGIKATEGEGGERSNEMKTATKVSLVAVMMMTAMAFALVETAGAAVVQPRVDQTSFVRPPLGSGFVRPSVGVVRPPVFNPFFRPAFNPFFRPAFNPFFRPVFNPFFRPAFNPFFDDDAFFGAGFEDD